MAYRSAEYLDVVVLLVVDGFGDGAANASGASCDCDSGYHCGVMVIDVQRRGLMRSFPSYSAQILAWVNIGAEISLLFKNNARLYV